MYLKQQKNESIFTGYFASINSDVEVKTFKRELKRIDKEFKSYEKKEAKADKKHFKSEGYFDYQNWQPETKVAESLDDIGTGSTLLTQYKKLRSLHLAWIIGIIDSLFGKAIINNLQGNNPSLFLFSMYKLSIIHFLWR